MSSRTQPTKQLQPQHSSRCFVVHLLICKSDLELVCSAEIDHLHALAPVTFPQPQANRCCRCLCTQLVDVHAMHMPVSDIVSYPVAVTVSVQVGTNLP
jgi:hypothetical protein